MADSREGKSAALASAYAALVAAGEPVTVRRLKEAAHVGTDAAAAWWKANRPSVEAPAAPDDFVRVVWPLAFTAARDVAVEDVAEELDAAREGEAVALADADAEREHRTQAEAQAAAAVEAQRAAERDAEQARREVEAERERTAQAEAQVRELLAERDRLAVQVREVEARAVRAEATVDTMREVVADLRAEVRSALDQATK